MKAFSFVSRGFLAAALLGLARQAPLQAAETDLTPEKTSEVMASAADLFLLDVRTPKEFDERHLGGAVNIPLQELEARAGELPKGRPVLIYCRSGKRAGRAGELLGKLRPDITDLMVLKGMPLYPAN